MLPSPSCRESGAIFMAHQKGRYKHGKCIYVVPECQSLRQDIQNLNIILEGQVDWAHDGCLSRTSPDDYEMALHWN